MSPRRTTPFRATLTSLAAAIGLAAALASCGGGGDSGGTLPPADGGSSAPATTVTAELKLQALNSSAGGAIQPGYDATQSGTDALHGASTAFCADRGAARFAELQSQWHAAMAAWQSVNAITGRRAYAGSNSTALRIEAWPGALAADVATRVDQLLVSSDALDKDALRGQPVEAQGLQALEYLLFQGRGPADFPANAVGDRRCGLLMGVSDNLATISNDFRTIWQRRGSVRSLGVETIEDAYNLLGNLLLGQLVRLRDNVLGPPIGLDSTGNAVNPNPASAESPRSDSSLAQAARQIQAAVKLFEGGAAGDAGFGRVLDQTGQGAVHNGFRSRADEALAQAQALLAAGKELSSANADTATHDKFKALFTAVRDLETYTRTQVLPALGIDVLTND